MAAKKSMFGLGTVVAAVTGVVAGAVGMFLSDEDNRKKVAKEVKEVEQMVEKDIAKVKKAVKKTTKKVATKAKKTAKKATKRKSR